MLYFPQEFFLEETREGFTIDSTMKSFWAAELEVLREVSEVCERHNLQWYAAYGTLLGAIRHNGYVPWDDDMDIWMKREDYNKFLEVAPKELPGDFVVESPQTEKGYTQFHSCVFNAISISLEEERLREFHGCPFATGIDIFPLDFLPRDEEEKESQFSLYYLIALMIELIQKTERDDEDEESLREAFDTVEEVCGVTFERELADTEKRDDLISEIYRLANQLCTCYGEDDGDYLVMYMDYARWAHKIYKKEWFEEAVLHPFEGLMIPVPIGYDDILKTIYGDYNVRIRSGTCHEYPLYNKQLRHLREVTEDLEGKVARINEILEEERNKRKSQQITGAEEN
ncbi:LicD family protein [Parablautia intestinalis]|jgi:lipopolysaccharide cholinephosphotransferase|uniref:LicD family protein n=1 Tax=Parablautia intestinalis TaxID=2320100 RepID=A0A3A9AM20_9FIRM|nr:LicD family protein [Parablautia intestinalis]MCI8614060.1 LicD family protein [Lachnospiraceae bacterium]RKI92399.1 LicD family protein [Parablautia intestinalis]